MLNDVLWIVTAPWQPIVIVWDGRIQMGLAKGGKYELWGNKKESAS